MSAPQFCLCLPGLRQAPAGIVKGLWRIHCVPEKDRNVTTIVVFTVLGVAVAAAVAAVLALIIIRNRHALGPPGQPLTEHPPKACTGECPGGSMCRMPRPRMRTLTWSCW